MSATEPSADHAARRRAATLMGLSGGVQLVVGTVLTLGLLVGVGGVGWFAIAYQGTATTTLEEVVVVMVTAVSVLVGAVIPLVSAFAALVAALHLHRGTRAILTVFACALSLTGPLYWVVLTGLGGIMAPVVAGVGVLVGTCWFLACLVVAVGSAWVALR